MCTSSVSTFATVSDIGLLRDIWWTIRQLKNRHDKDCVPPMSEGDAAKIIPLMKSKMVGCLDVGCSFSLRLMLVFKTQYLAQFTPERREPEDSRDLRREFAMGLIPAVPINYPEMDGLLELFPFDKADIVRNIVCVLISARYSNPLLFFNKSGGSFLGLDWKRKSLPRCLSRSSK